MTIRAQSWYSFAAAACCLVLLSGYARGQVPLFEQEPYDVITLDEHNENAVLKVQPLPKDVVPGRRVPEPLPKSGKFEVRLLEKPESTYEVQWHSIAQVVLFNELVLGRAEDLVAAERIEEAYDYFKFLLNEDPKLPGLDGAIEDYLYEEAKQSKRNGQYADALAMLRELHARNPRREGLADALGIVTEELVERYLKADDYWNARKMLRNLAALYPDHTLVTEREGQLKREAARFLVDGRKAEQAGQLRDAHQAGRRLMQVWPDLPEGKQFIDSIQRQYPRVVVGVTLPAAAARPGRLIDWASRRSCRLAYRTLMEFVGRGTEGGEYYCPYGEMQVEELGLRLAFQISPERSRSAGAAALTGYDLARQLLAMADPADDAYRLDWAELLDQVSPVREVYSVDVDLRRPHVRPEALLQTVVLAGGSGSDPNAPAASTGPYVVEARTEDEVVYVCNPQYSVAARQPSEIVERYYRKATEAVAALDRHQIDVLDRVNPWDLDKVRAMDGVVVEPYAMPSLHCLVPNPRKPFTARREFRRALAYGIHREAILNHLLRGERLSGCRVISGPFSPGVSPDDPLDYGYNHAVEPREYQPHLAIALAQVALSEVAAAMKKQGIEVSDTPKFVLAHPAHEIARVACTSIQRQLGLVDIPITLRELKAGLPDRIPDDVDLLYAELAMWEPVVDARRLLEEDGIAGGCSTYMSQALGQLDQATDWAQVADRLRHIHWLAHRELPVVPLWQLIDHFAYRRSLKGVGSRPVSLYQNVEQWQPSTQYAAEGK